jgi:hypothetical protein
MQSPDLIRPATPPTRASTAQTAIRDPLPSPLRRTSRIRPFSTLNQAVAQLDEAEVRSWSPRQVAEWMTAAGFEGTVVDKFLSNDITGAILIELQFEDLKELDIQSFGKRHRLMNEIQHLRNSSMLSLQIPAKSPLRSASRSQSMSRKNSTQAAQAPTPNECTTPISPEKEEEEGTQRRRRRHRRQGEEISPAESVSIVAIEQLLPKPHKCSKGEDCPKWRKQQRKLARLAKEFPIEPEKGGSTFIAGDPGNPVTAENLFRPKSEAEPSVVASSDVLGPGQLPQFHLSPEMLSEVKPRDPQENVRQFLSFQHVPPPPIDEPPTPPLELFPNMDSPRVHENLRNLPRLTIPAQAEEAFLNSQRTITPSMIHRAKTPSSAIAVDPYYNDSTSAIDVYRQDTPFSEMDVPVTAVPLGPVARETSQSVPPDMRYGAGSSLPSIPEPIIRPCRIPSHRHRPSFAALSRLDEGQPLRPIIQVSSNSAPTTATGPSPTSATAPSTFDVNYAGYMKKRKTTRLLRHEWQENYYTLNGTRLACHKDTKHISLEVPSEYIDVDDYAIACSSLASSNKLTATFKKWAKHSGASSISDETAFAFQLVPADGKRSLLSKSGEKTHHFAVRTRDQRIDWMRELMLAKALKQRGEGYEVNVNGTSF